MLDAAVLEQRPQVRCAVNTSSSSTVHKKPGAGNCSEMGGEKEEGNRFSFFFFLSQKKRSCSHFAVTLR